MIADPILDGPSFQMNAMSKKERSDVFSARLTGASGFVIRVVGLLMSESAESPYTLYATTLCNVPLSSLTSPPYNLNLGSSIDVKVIAYNVYGDSDYSAVGSGDFIVLVPDAPIQLANMPDVTNVLQIGLQWQDGSSDNGKLVEDYTVSYDQSTGVWVNLITGLTV